MWRWEGVREGVKMRGCERRCEDEKVWEKMWRWEGVREDEKVWRWEGVREDVKMRRCERRCEDEKVWEKMWRWEGVREDEKMRRCERRCEDEKVWEKMRRWEGVREDVKMRRCERRCEDEKVGEKMWRWEGVREDVKMRRCERRCEDEKVWEKMWRWEGVKMRYRPPLLEERCAQTLSGKVERTSTMWISHCKCTLWKRWCSRNFDIIPLCGDGWCRCEFQIARKAKDILPLPNLEQHLEPKATFATVPGPIFRVHWKSDDFWCFVYVLQIHTDRELVVTSCTYFWGLPGLGGWL